MRRRRAAAAVALATALLAMAGCDEKLSDVVGPTPNLTPTFSSIQQNIFESSDSSGRAPCVNCHTSVGHAAPAGLDLRHEVAYASLVSVASREKPGAIRVEPGDPDSSYLVEKLEGAPGIVGLRMPRSGPPYLTDGQILAIKRWIQLGAPQD